ncbi:MAG: hypothetical protein U0271_46420 [Polyangiaceae bacterium]
MLSVAELADALAVDALAVDALAAGALFVLAADELAPVERADELLFVVDSLDVSDRFVV